jgi:heme A synthase
MSQSLRTNYNWGVLAFLFAVILWGSFVRASGSGAGCGDHWPLCTGTLIPESTSWHTVVEFTHRLTSGLSLLLCAGVCAISFSFFPRGSFVRKAGAASLFFILTEAIIGAGLVLLRLVEHDQSYLRAISLAVHLMNTFFLLAAVTLTARWSELGGVKARQNTKGLAWASGIAIFICLVLGASGAVTALGDTLFPAASLQAGFAQDLSPTRSFLIELRIFHPVIAVMVSLYLIVFARFGIPRDLSNPRVAFHVWGVLGLQCLQLCLGVSNLLLLAPIWLQLVHLLVADLIWVNLILLMSEVWTVSLV